MPVQSKDDQKAIKRGIVFSNVDRPGKCIHGKNALFDKIENMKSEFLARSRVPAMIIETS